MATEEHQKKPSRWTRLLDWQHKGQLFLDWWAHDNSGYQGRDATHRRAHDQGLNMDSIAQVIHERKTCSATKEVKSLKSLWFGAHWLKYKDGETGKMTFHFHKPAKVLTMVKATSGGWKHAVSYATAHNTVLGLKKQILWQYGLTMRQGMSALMSCPCCRGSSHFCLPWL